MTYKSEILLGRITKVSGFEGAVTVKLEKNFYDNLPYMESVFLEIEGKPVPFFLAETEYSGGGTLKLTFEDYDSAEKVTEFKDCRVFLTTGFNENSKTPDIHNLTGYEVYSNEHDLLGSINEIIENPGQLLLNIRSPKNKEILIPFHEDFIIGIDNRKRIIVMDLPEGLIDLN
jgi:16S rRNA processing protein RimM